MRALPRRWWRSRLGADFLRELALVLSLLAFYKYGRFIVRDQAESAFEHGRALINAERSLGVFTEAGLQQFALDRGKTVLRALNAYYLYAHVVITAAVFLWLFMRHPNEYVRFRRVMVAMTLVGLALHLAYPLAPPRMFPDLGFVDTGKLVGPAAYGHDSAYEGLANEFAAMPSLHFGWAMAAAWSAVIALRSRWRFLVVFHPTLTLAAIVVTANHYWFDAAAAAALFIAGLEIDHLRRHRLQKRDGARDQPQSVTVAAASSSISA